MASSGDGSAWLCPRQRREVGMRRTARGPQQPCWPRVLVVLPALLLPWFARRGRHGPTECAARSGRRRGRWRRQRQQPQQRRRRRQRRLLVRVLTGRWWFRTSCPRRCRRSRGSCRHPSRQPQPQHMWMGQSLTEGRLGPTLPPLCRKPVPVAAVLAGRSNRPRRSASGQQLPSSCRCGRRTQRPRPT